MSNVKDPNNADSSAAQTIEPTTPPEPKKKEGDVTVALRIERDKRREVQSKLDAYEASQAKAEEERLVEQGKFQELYDVSNKSLESANTQLKAMQATIDGFSAVSEARIKESLAGLSEDDQAFAHTLVEGKNQFEKEKIISSLVARLATPKSINGKVELKPDPQNPSGSTGSDNLKDLYAEAQKKGDIVAMTKLADELYRQGVEVNG